MASQPCDSATRRRISLNFAWATAVVLVAANAGTGWSIGDDQTHSADRASIGGTSGQDVVANYPESQAGPGEPETVEPTRWWTWTAPEDGRYMFNTHGSEVDTVITVSTGQGSTVASNDDHGDVVTSAVSFDAEAGETYDIRVDVKDDEAALITLGWHLNSPPDPEARSDAPPRSMTEEFADIPTSVNTGEKPQSKMWKSQGTWWAVLASTDVSPTGTWVWRYDEAGDTWTNTLRVSPRTDVRGDVKVVGDVVHVVLHGPVTTMVSIAYDDAAGTYEMWDERPDPTEISLPGSETATLDIDSTDRMWIAADTESEIQVRYSDPPYSSFSSPITVASGIDDDDIGMVMALSGDRIGVLWSDQNTERFGFRTHADGSDASAWTHDEVPADQSAAPIGDGMADDHLNVAVSSDGTLYAAVKTSFDSSSAPTIALLVRRPSGTWDPMHEVDGVGTRPIVIVDEDAEVVRVLYTESTDLDDILEKRTPMRNVDFDGGSREVLDGDHNNVTSTKANVVGRAMIMAAGEDTTRSTILTGP